MIDITGLRKDNVLRALYAAAKPLGMGFLHYTPEPMTQHEADMLLASAGPGYYFDYVVGRGMKVRLGGDVLNEALYDRDNGPGAALRALQPLLDARDRGGAHAAN